ncbi:MAG: topoisomerase IV [Oscillospiraceae bacterium]|nr:topoisomerase IV [Oscillospiraceae bacterium]MCR4760612.1 topoisomerase IV [Oscillospiraceae bacterium]
MPRKKKETAPKAANPSNAYIEGAGLTVEERITETLRKNFMPYAMSAIVSRALPEIDGFKPSHRKLLYTMYKMGLLSGARTKSANVVGQTMRLNPHGDAAIYETMVRLARGNESLLHPYVDSKGNFGKVYSRDMAYAAPRYTEVRLEPIAAELFSDIDKETVDFVPNYDNTMNEPTLLPATFPSVLVNANVGIAVSMASNVCPFNLSEVCETTVALIQDPAHDLLSTLKGPDFPTGAFMLYDEEEMRKIYDTGRGSIRLRSKWNYDKAANCIEVTQIPYSTTIEAIMEKIVELVKAGKIREISYLRDETDLNGLKLTLDLKRGTDPDKLMQKLYRLTPLQDTVSCNFNILIAGMPKVMGVREILEEWIAFRTECIRRRVYFDLHKKMDKLHLLEGLEKILLDIDRAIKIVRETEEESEVVSNLMIGFGIDNVQAEYVAEIKLRHLNREYILNRTKEIEQLRKDIAEMEDILKDVKKIRRIMIAELKKVAQKYAQPRKTMFYDLSEEPESTAEDDTPDYPVHLFLSAEGYFKKITPQSLRMSSDQKLKEGDVMTQQKNASNRTELLFFTDQAQVYKTRAAAFDDTKASVLGDFVPVKLGFDDGERVKFMIATDNYSGFVLFCFENGKIAKVPLNAYMTKTNRKKLANAYSAKNPIVDILYIEEDCNVLLRSTNNRAVVFHTAMLLPKSTRDSIGVQVMTLKAKSSKLDSAAVLTAEQTEELKKYIVKNIPASGGMAKDLELAGQMTL